MIVKTTYVRICVISQKNNIELSLKNYFNFIKITQQ